MPELKNNATQQIAGTIYQFYIAVDECFDLKENETVFIEKYGDITISNNQQTEVKSNNNPLTDLDENLWKTLSNWLDEKFNPNYYKKLILLTNQTFGEQSTLIGWNEKNFSEKRAVLESIKSKYLKKNTKSETTKKLLELVLNTTNKEKLNIVLEKFLILDSTPNPINYYEELKQKWGKNVLKTNRDDYINAILGFIISPKSGLHSNSWKISYEDFTNRVIALTERYCSSTKIFPQKINTLEITNEEIKSKEKHLFIKKIDEIEYVEVKNQAIKDYIRTNKTISDELSKYSVLESDYELYEKDLLAFYEPKHRKASRNSKKEEIIRQSQDFYDSIMETHPHTFLDFNNTPFVFRNGIMHNLADDESKNIKWKLNTNFDE